MTANVAANESSVGAVACTPATTAAAAIGVFVDRCHGPPTTTLPAMTPAIVAASTGASRRLRLRLGRGRAGAGVLATRTGTGLGRDARHDRAHQVGDRFRRPNADGRAHAERAGLERPASSTRRRMRIDGRAHAFGGALPIEASGEDGLRAVAVHRAASSSSSARQSAWRARNIRLFTVPTRTFWMSATS